MKKILKNPWTYFIIVLILFVAFYSYKNITGKAVQGQYDEFAKYLTEQGAKMYGAYWCEHCQNQKKPFGEGVLENSKIYVECDPKGKNPETDLCLSKGIQGYPTWEINGQLYPGEQSIGRLAQLTGYDGGL